MHSTEQQLTYRYKQVHPSPVPKLRHPRKPPHDISPTHPPSPTQHPQSLPVKPNRSAPKIKKNATCRRPKMPKQRTRVAEPPIPRSPTPLALSEPVTRKRKTTTTVHEEGSQRQHGISKSKEGKKNIQFKSACRPLSGRVNPHFQKPKATASEARDEMRRDEGGEYVNGSRGCITSYLIDGYECECGRAVEPKARLCLR